MFKLLDYYPVATDHREWAVLLLYWMCTGRTLHLWLWTSAGSDLWLPYRPAQRGRIDPSLWAKRSGGTV